LKANIKEWASKNYEIGRKSFGGWIIKCPFTTGTLFSYYILTSFMAAYVKWLLGGKQKLPCKDIVVKIYLIKYTSNL
jgi:hypothetical protein